jgi:hypothetical protein
MHIYICVYICVHAEVRTCIRMCACAYICKCACMYLYARTCVCVCICAHRFACMYVCAWCVHSDVRSCGGGCMHICMKSVRVSFLFLHHLHPGNLQWGWLACTAHTQTLVLLALLLLNPLLSNYWLLLNHVRDSLRGTRLLNSTKTFVRNCRTQGLWIFVVSRRVKGRF